MLRSTPWIIFSAALLCAYPLHGGEPHDEPPPELTSEEFMVANTLWTLLHETAHALIDELDIPVFGHEEDAADQIATIALLHGTTDLGVPDSVAEVESVIAAAQAWRVEWELDKRAGTQTVYWDSHSLDIQRFYNILCLLYGSDPEKYDEVQGQLGLPYQRAFACVDYEHEQARRAVTGTTEAYGLEKDDNAVRGHILVVYEKPLNEERQRIAEAIQQAGIAELVAKHTERLHTLPSDITIVFASCFGDETAFWRSDRKEIVMCYDLLERFLYLYQAKQCLEMTGISDEDLQACLRQRPN